MLVKTLILSTTMITPTTSHGNENHHGHGRDQSWMVVVMDGGHSHSDGHGHSDGHNLGWRS